MESPVVRGKRLGKWLIIPAAGTAEGDTASSEARVLEAGGVSETLAALTLAEARATCSSHAEKVEDVVAGAPVPPGTDSAEVPLETAVKQTAGDLNDEVPAPAEGQSTTLTATHKDEVGGTVRGAWP